VQAVPGPSHGIMGEFTARDIVGPMRAGCRQSREYLESKQFRRSRSIWKTQRGDIELQAGAALSSIEAHFGNGHESTGSAGKKAAFQLRPPRSAVKRSTITGRRSRRKSEGRQQPR